MLMTRVSFLALVFLLSASYCLAQEDILEKQAALLQEGKSSIPELLASYQEMMRRRPQDPIPYVLAASVYHRAQSRTLYEKAIELSPDFVPARVGLARYYVRDGNMREALAQFQKAISLARQSRALRLEGIRAAVKASQMDQARMLAGDQELKLEIVHSLIDINDIEGAKRALSGFAFDAGDSGPILAARGRLLYQSGQKQNDKKQLQQGVDLLVQSWRKAPELLLHYRSYNPYPRESLVQVLAKTGRREELRAVIEKGVQLFPDEYPLYESLWKMQFAEPKSDYSAERKAVQAQIEMLLKNHKPSAGLLRVAALGYRMAGAARQAELIDKQLLAQFPFSSPARMLRRSQAVSAADPREKVELLKRFNHDFPDLPLYSEYFKTLDELNAPAEELLKAAEEYIHHEYPRLAVWDIGQVFVRRNIYLDRVSQWIDRVKKATDASIDAWDVRILTVKGKLLLLQGRKQEAENTLRQLLKLERQGLSNVDKGRIKYHLGEVMEAQGKLEEALDWYAQGYAESQHYITEAGESFKRLFLKLRGGESGMEEFLSIREGMYQVAANVGIERGTRIDRAAPDFGLLSLKGEQVTLASLRGKVVILNFWATWCGPCIKELPHLQEFLDRMKGDPGVAVIAVSTDENRALVEPFMKKNGYTFTVLFDEGLRNELGVRGIPTTFIIDPAGMIRLRMVGFNPNEPLVPYLTKLVEQYRLKKGAVGQ